MSLEQKMVYGHETEFAITTIPNSPWPVDHDEVIREVFSYLKQTRTIGIFRQRTKEKIEPAKGALLYNGGTLYEDIGHLEYATPECATLDQIVAAILAGRRLAADVVNQVDRRNALKGNTPPLPSHIVLTLNSDFTLDSNNGLPNVHASHENYSDGIDDEYRTMMLFLATRGIFTDPAFFSYFGWILAISSLGVPDANS